MTNEQKWNAAAIICLLLGVFITVVDPSINLSGRLAMIIYALCGYCFGRGHVSRSPLE